MVKIQGIDKLRRYLADEGHPLTQVQVEKLLEDRKLPHVRYGKVYLFYKDHIDWWIRQERKKRITE